MEKVSLVFDNAIAVEILNNIKQMRQDLAQLDYLKAVPVYPEEAAKLLGCKVSSLKNVDYRHNNNMPMPLKGAIRWDRNEFYHYLGTLKQESEETKIMQALSTQQTAAKKRFLK